MSKLLMIDDEGGGRALFVPHIFDLPEVELTTASCGEEAFKLIPQLKGRPRPHGHPHEGITGLETLLPSASSTPSSA